MTRQPDFFLVGAPKRGTTAMHAYLRMHPEIFMPHDLMHWVGQGVDQTTGKMPVPHNPPNMERRTA
ncbi:MAG: sulfotransferase [Pirellulales bacterium]|nr:sulfotransferase [Pirellulales bacterium]